MRKVRFGDQLIYMVQPPKLLRRTWKKRIILVNCYDLLPFCWQTQVEENKMISHDSPDALEWGKDQSMDP